MNRKFDNAEYRNAWLESHVRHLIASQIRELRGAQGQGEFGQKIEASQSVVARYESPSYGRMTISTLLDIAKKLRIGLQVRFVPFSAVMDEAKNLTSADLAPVSYEVDMKIRDSRRSRIYATNDVGGARPVLADLLISPAPAFAAQRPPTPEIPLSGHLPPLTPSDALARIRTIADFPNTPGGDMLPDLMGRLETIWQIANGESPNQGTET